MDNKHKTKLKHIISGNWYNFNEGFRHESFSLEELEYMLAEELSGERRKQVVISLHQRLSTLRTIQERTDLIRLCEEK